MCGRLTRTSRGVPRFEAGGQVLGKRGVIEDAPIEPVLQARQVFALTGAAASSRAVSRAAGASHPGCAVRVRIRSWSITPDDCSGRSDQFPIDAGSTRS